jgi:hypothetical protein
MTPEEEEIILRLASLIIKTRDDPAILRRYGILGNIQKHTEWINAMLFIEDLINELLEGKKNLPTLDEAKNMLDETDKTTKEFREFIKNKREEMEKK